MAAALNRGAPLPETTYRPALNTFGEQGLAEIVFLVGCFSMVGITLNAFDAAVPGREDSSASAGGLDKTDIRKASCRYGVSTWLRRPVIPWNESSFRRHWQLEQSHCRFA